MRFHKNRLSCFETWIINHKKAFSLWLSIRFFFAISVKKLLIKLNLILGKKLRESIFVDTSNFG